MKTRILILALFLIAGASLFAGPRVVIGVGFGGYGPGYYAPAPVYYQPPCPGPGYSWVGGYWYGYGPRRVWRAGYWAPPAYYRPYYAGPRYYREYRGGHYYRDEYREHHGYYRDYHR